MKKILKNFFIIIFLFLFLYISFSLLNIVNAASVSVGSATVNQGESATLSISIPNGFCGYQDGSISLGDSSKVNFKSCSVSGANVSAGSISNINAVNFDATTYNFLQAPNFSISVKGLAEGSSNVNVNITLVKDDGSTEYASGSGTISVKSAQNPTVNSQPETPSQPTPVVEKEPNFKAVNDTVYATKSMNVRSSWSTSSKKIGGLSKDQGVTRTGIGDNGWSRISYNGKTAYVSTALITTTKPEEKPAEEPKEENNTSTNETEVNTIENEDDSENKDENEVEVEETLPEENNESIDEEAYKNIVSKVGTIPEVGNNINIYIFFIICIISLSSIYIIFKK